jgi:hypothetical protein
MYGSGGAHRNVIRPYDWWLISRILAIFTAGASLIEDHEKKRKAEHGHNGTVRGRLADGVDAAGASFGCIGLMAFAIILWGGMPGHNVYCQFHWQRLSGWACQRLSAHCGGSASFTVDQDHDEGVGAICAITPTKSLGMFLRRRAFRVPASN